MGHEQGIEAIRAFLHTIWWLRVDLSSSSFTSSRHLFDYSNATMTIKGLNYASFVVYISTTNANGA